MNDTPRILPFGSTSKVLALHADGATVREIARELDLSTQGIYSTLRLHELAPNPTTPTGGTR